MKLGKRAWKRRVKEWDGYWRDKVYECAMCRLYFPSSYYSKSRSKSYGLHCYCKRCQAHYASNRIRRKEVKPKYKQLYKDRYWKDDGGESSRSEARQRYAANIELARKKHRDKYKKRRAEIREYMQDYLRQPWQRLMLMARYVRNQYKVEVSKEELRAYWLKHPKFKKAMERWKNSGYDNHYSPSFKCPNPKKFEVSKMVLTTRYYKLKETRKKLNQRKGKGWQQRGVKGRFGTDTGDASLKSVPDANSSDH